MKTILGEVSIESWLFSLGLSILGFTLFKLLKFKKSKSKHKFNLKFWWSDNNREVFIALISFYMIIRFYDDLINPFSNLLPFIKPYIENMHLIVFFFGLSLNIITEKLRTRFNFKSNQSKSELIGGRPDDR